MSRASRSPTLADVWPSPMLHKSCPMLNHNPPPRQICGHARAVTGLDVVGGTREGELFRAVSAGEDTFVRVWAVQGGTDTQVGIG